MEYVTLPISEGHFETAIPAPPSHYLWGKRSEGIV